MGRNIEFVRAARRRWYAKNKQRQIARQLVLRRQLQDWLQEYKRTLNCSRCGMSFKDCPECLDFHHVDPHQKEGVISVMRSSSKPRMLKELNKCVPLCANCHRTVTFQSHSVNGKPSASKSETESSILS